MKHSWVDNELRIVRNQIEQSKGMLKPRHEGYYSALLKCKEHMIDKESEVEFLKSFFFDFEGRVGNNLTRNEMLFKLEKRIKELKGERE